MPRVLNPPPTAIVIGGLLLSVLLGCGAEPILIEGQFGRSIELASGDLSPLPRVAFIDHGCIGAAGGCASVGDGSCQTLLVDSLAPLTSVRSSEVDGSTISTECLEIRTAGGLLADSVSPQVLDHAVARFRFDNLPLVRAPDDSVDTWTAGDQRQAIEPAGILGGNLLRNFAVQIRSEGVQPSTLTLYTEYPGRESILADQGRAFIPLQFPGRLLGRELTDRCAVDQGPCQIDGFNFSTSSREIPLVATRMVLDACVAIPPCGLHYAPSTDDPFAPGRCSMRRGPRSEIACDDVDRPALDGLSASVVVATGVTGLVLFSDSATRMFGELSELSLCPDPSDPTIEVDDSMLACRIADDGVLHFAGWPSAGLETPLPRIRIRSLALVPGANRSRTIGPCQRAAQRRDDLRLQCTRYRSAALSRGDIRDATPPYSPKRDDDDGDDHSADPGSTSVAVLGEATLQDGAGGPRPARWIESTVMPLSHPLVFAVRRDVAPDALQPDGLLGTTVFADTEVVLDYTDINPSIRLTCLEPHSGRCQVIPDCRQDLRPSCCHGLPRPLLNELIRTLNDDTCCGALSAEDLAELQPSGHCVGVLPP